MADKYCVSKVSSIGFETACRLMTMIYKYVVICHVIYYQIQTRISTSPKAIPISEPKLTPLLF